MYQNIENADFKKLMEQSDTLVMDVRSPREIQEGYIAGTSVFIDINSEPFELRIQDLDKTKNYLVYCRSGARSAMACRIMYENGFTGKLFNLANGINRWNGEVTRAV
jgi:rhodanese-related sulfurtransferase